MSEAITNKIQDWRRRSALPPGHVEAMTIIEYREAIEAIRKERMAASETSTKSRVARAEKAEKAKPIDSNDLLSELGL